MSNQNDGGPAFPIEFKFGDGTATRYGGMTLRDYFAAKTIDGLLSSGRCTLECHDRYRAAELAELSYLVADAMLSERSKGNEQTKLARRS